MRKFTIPARGRAAALGFFFTLAAAGTAAADQVIADDLIVQGSLCVGQDCVNGESFGFDTIRLKENNTRIKFDDTSNSGSFPSNDWEITANDSANGGASYLGILDATSGRQIGRFEAGARANAFVVEDDGDIGFGTLNPVVNLHIVKGNTPTIRLEQDGSSGFSPRSWDIAGNETNFFVRDVTGGSKLPFKILPGSSDNRLVIKGANVGIGLLDPLTALHVAGESLRISGTSPTIRLQAAGGNFDLNADNGQNLFRILDNSGTVRLALNANGSFAIPNLVSCGAGIQTNGNGVLSCQGSSRYLKNIGGALEPEVAMANVMALKPQVGSYKVTPDEPEHWLIAEDVAEVDPAFVVLKDGAPYTVKIYGVVADLVAVIQVQQKRIEALEAAVDMR